MKYYNSFYERLIARLFSKSALFVLVNIAILFVFITNLNAKQKAALENNKQYFECVIDSYVKDSQTLQGARSFCDEVYYK